MLNPSAKSPSPVQLLEAKNAANTAQASGGWVDCRKAEGDLLIVQSVGTITGNLQGSFETASAANGAGNVACLPPGGNLALVSAANNIQSVYIPASMCLGWMKYIGTVGTGPVQVSVTAHFHPKYTS
jgi:hypothetical protein